MSIEFRSANRERAYRLTSGRCFYCLHPLAADNEGVPTGTGFTCPPGKKFFELDHKLPRCQRGSNRPENLVPACGFCNGRKGGKSADEYRVWLQNKYHGPVRFFEDIAP